ncbi:MAG: Fe2+/Zn2+ uptake regulation protein, Fur family transcriptional regulator, ferric uptake regulator [Candidatus Peregrinibacteria bacterium GW2011_GWE2_39_6]|nr:MAG: Fe2+/Zn2+ uptake regulation protein, Fur family transcriptional regulator, ferric uptake regulator [Candidatus Peregrinibacteria bacterium GW2011_GWF2_39_17]KKR24186.1 MAG: Fe2+/Zn2+ uptake regulation protein, Fur family transcriptional regulator, ferric uptake regulator [Candidatus Peregrinibacteria bacterium GW2011_GWE2_39_6]HCW32102.1 hypothetical protein [Candidatus Peregrinibacteria bacterium]
MNKESLYKNIRAQGGRVTKIRRELVRILTNLGCLISQADILIYLKEKNMFPNRSTVYRELRFLSENGIVIKNTIAGVNYYETPHDHHHHLVCLGCNSINKVEMPSHLGYQEKRIAKENKFYIRNHSLEFYGYCFSCQPRFITI